MMIRHVTMRCSLTGRPRLRSFTRTFAERSYVVRNTDPENMSAEEYDRLKKHNVRIVLDNIRSANNVGSIFRTADAAAVDEVLCCGYTPSPPHKKVSKTALGAEHLVKMRQFTSTRDCIVKLKQEGVKVIALETTSKSKDHIWFEYPSNVAFVFGNEVSGIDREVRLTITRCMRSSQ